AYRERKARINPAPINNDRAGAALPAVAALFGSGQVQPFAQKIKKSDARIIEVDGPRDTVDDQRYWKTHGVLHKSDLEVIFPSHGRNSVMVPDFGRPSARHSSGLWPSWT